MDDAAARAVLRAHDEQPPTRGRLAPEWHAKATHYADQDAGAGDYAEGTSPGDFGPDPVDDPEPGGAAGESPLDLEAAEPPAPVAERRPERPRAGSGRSAVARKWAAKFRADADRAARHGGGRPHKRISLEPLISSMWAGMGGLAGQVDPPLGRVLVMQAPVSGLILEDVVKGTAADRVLQPIARAGAKGEKVLALVAPPMIVAALEASAALPERQQAARQAILLPLLERSLVLWSRIAGDNVEKMAQRLAEEGPAREQARELIGMIWPQVPAPAGADGQAPAPSPA